MGRLDQSAQLKANGQVGGLNTRRLSVFLSADAAEAHLVSLSQYRGRKNGTTKAKPAWARKLREQGLNNVEIAKALGVSRRTAVRYLATDS